MTGASRARIRGTMAAGHEANGATMRRWDSMSQARVKTLKPKRQRIALDNKGRGQKSSASKKHGESLRGSKMSHYNKRRTLRPGRLELSESRLRIHPGKSTSKRSRGELERLRRPYWRTPQQERAHIRDPRAGRMGVLRWDKVNLGSARAKTQPEEAHK